MATPATDGFVGETRRDQVLVVLGGVLACWIGYFGAVALVYGDVSALVAGEETTDPRRVAAIGSGIVCWGYYGLAFVRARGGPVLNATIYPPITLVLAPIPARWLTFGPDPWGLVSGLFSFSFEPLVLLALTIGPGLGGFVTILLIWSATIDPDERREWERRHLTAAFYDEFVDVSD